MIEKIKGNVVDIDAKQISDFTSDAFVGKAFYLIRINETEDKLEPYELDIDTIFKISEFGTVTPENLTDDDVFVFEDESEAWAKKKINLNALKTFFKTYFDGFYIVGIDFDSLTNKNYMADNDFMLISDSEDSDITKKVIWTDIINTIKITLGQGGTIENLSAEFLSDASLSNDGTFADDSDLNIPTEKAIKTYITNKALDKIGWVDLSTSTSLGNSDVLVASQKAIKTYTDDSGIDVGDIIMSPQETKNKFFRCNGGQLSRTTYPELFAKVTTNLGTVTISVGANAVITFPTAHGLRNNTCIEFSSTGTLPTGILPYKNYYVWLINSTQISLRSTRYSSTRITTSSAGSGVHSVRHIPYGGVNSTTYLLPNFQAVVPKGLGNQVINGRTKYGPEAIGSLLEDQMITHNHYYNQAITFSTLAWGVYSTYFAVYSGAYTGNNSGRSGNEVRDNNIGVNFFIRYE